jgi:hypothetical protein
LTAFFLGCSSNAKFSSDFNGSASLKDRTIINYECKIIFRDINGVKEYEEKKESINHGLRVILIQRNRDQFENAARLKHILGKLLKSQLRDKVKDIKVIKFTITS